MLVTVTGFGSVWRVRRDAKRPAFFNTTGIPVNGEARSFSKIAGHTRFNGFGGFNPHSLERMLNGVFECGDPSVWENQNKVLFKRRISVPVRPDFLLVVVRSWELGHMDLATATWRSEGTFLISLSEHRDQREAMLLMPLGAWLRTDLGTFRLQAFTNWPWTGRLQLQL